jgi:hypothetical protein
VGHSNTLNTVEKRKLFYPRWESISDSSVVQVVAYIIFAAFNLINFNIHVSVAISLLFFFLLLLNASYVLNVFNAT